MPSRPSISSRVEAVIADGINAAIVIRGLPRPLRYAILNDVRNNRVQLPLGRAQRVRTGKSQNQHHRVAKKKKNVSTTFTAYNSRRELQF